MTPLVIPAGKKTGCLLRTSKPGGLCSLWGEKMEVLTPDEITDAIGQVELSPIVPCILDQDGVGSCATESTSAGVMLSRVLAGFPHALLNPWFIYHHTSGGRDQGSSIDENLDFVRVRGVAPESTWPRSKGWQAKPTPEAYDAALAFRIAEWWDCTTIAEIQSALVRGFPVVMGWQGHSVLLTDILNMSEALYQNSWGQAWGAEGFGRIRFSSINFAYGAFAVRAVL